MVARPSIVHPRMLAALGDFYPGRLDVLAGDTTRDPESGEVESSWTYLYQDLPATVAPAVIGGVANTEQRTGQQTIVTEMWIASLPGEYPAITTGHRVVYEGADYNVLGVEFDSHRKTTRLKLERVTA